MARALSRLWTRDSRLLLSGFFLVIFLIVYIWWPLAEEYLAYMDWNGPWWLYMDWLLIGVFLFMSLTIISRADLKTDGMIVFVGVFGGLAIESFYALMLIFVAPTFDKSYTWLSLLLCGLLILNPTDHRFAFLTFIAG